MTSTDPEGKRLISSDGSVAKSPAGPTGDTPPKDSTATWTKLGRAVLWVVELAAVPTLLAAAWSWILNNPILGKFVVLAGLLALGFFVAQGHVRMRDSDVEVGRLRDENSQLREQVQAYVAMRSTKDVDLLRDRLKGWEPKGRVYRAIVTNGIVHTHFPEWLWLEIGRKTEEWRFDERSIANDSLAKAWSDLVDSVQLWNSAIGEYMWEKDRYSDDPDRAQLHVPPEWELSQRERFERAYTELGQAYNRVIRALTRIDAAIHEAT